MHCTTMWPLPHCFITSLHCTALTFTALNCIYSQHSYRVFFLNGPTLKVWLPPSPTLHGGCAPVWWPISLEYQICTSPLSLASFWRHDSFLNQHIFRFSRYIVFLTFWHPWLLCKKMQKMHFSQWWVNSVHRGWASLLHILRPNVWEFSQFSCILNYILQTAIIIFIKVTVSYTQLMGNPNANCAVLIIWSVVWFHVKAWGGDCPYIFRLSLFRPGVSCEPGMA